MLTDLQRDALRTITELSDRGAMTSTVDLARELNIIFHEAVRTAHELVRTSHVEFVKSNGIWLSPLTRAELPPDDMFVGFFEDAERVKEFDERRKVE